MKHLVIAAAVAALSFAAHADTFAPASVGVHLGSWHSNKDAQGRSYNGVNPGLYARWDNGATVGSYYNSERRMTAYAGWTFETPQWHRLTAAVTAGGIVGYKKGPMIFAIPSAAVHVTERTAVRVSFVPKMEKDGAAAIHLSAEHRF